MKVAVVLLEEKEQASFATFIADNALRASPLAVWRVRGEIASVGSLLPALVAEYRADPVELLLFPPSVEGDELATRLAWRLGGGAVCQALSWDALANTATKAVYGSALTATLRAGRFPLCLSLSRSLSPHTDALSAGFSERAIAADARFDALPPPEILAKSTHPLQSAAWVLAIGQGASDEVFTQLAVGLNAEQGFTRQRVMAGGCDEQCMLGISGQSIAPEVCLIAGASGAAAFMAGVARSRFIVAINTDPAAAVFAAADVGIVGDAQEVLQALAACASEH